MIWLNDLQVLKILKRIIYDQQELDYDEINKYLI